MLSVSYSAGTVSPPVLASMPPEILLYISKLLYADVSPLRTLASTCHYLASLFADSILQRTRLLVVAPSRLSHSLFGIGPEGSPLRPTVSDLIRRGVMKGFNIEQHWRAGLYLYSALARIPSCNVATPQASDVVSSKLRRWSLHPNSFKMFYKTHVLPDVESSSPFNSRSLLPVVRRSKWSFQRDSISRITRIIFVSYHVAYRIVAVLLVRGISVNVLFIM
ncbi:hypothetical protein BC827DRAFT_1121126 [Russula dissimulans]|nr:hypothetical protein BC827DRAFT_1121126 [Russula dissimulans]